MTGRSDVELMLALKAGDEDAFTELVDRHRDAVVNLTYRYLGNKSDAEDLAQDVFLKVYRARGSYEPAAKFTTWLYRVAANACLNEVRDRRRRPTFGAAAFDAGESAPMPAADRAGSSSPLEEAERSEMREHVREALAGLPERQRMALVLNKFQGLGYEELADSLEMTVPAVKSLLVRAREGVRRRIEPYLRAGKGRSAERKGAG
jgi:RNA polymerase sigma-70 factor (ECF subfamily)